MSSAPSISRDEERNITMKITKTQLRQIIKEELEKSLEEAWGQPFGDAKEGESWWCLDDSDRLSVF